MGSIQTSENTDFLYENYEVTGQEGELKILCEKKTKEQFALKQICFLNKGEYDVYFKRIREKERELRNMENTLKIVKLWSKEHNGVCSNLFKIYAVYEYPKVRLIDEIQARKVEDKPFQEAELLSILQSCLNAFATEPTYINISPHLIFVVPEGILKLINPDLADSHFQTTYNNHFYYSPQKMEDFQLARISQDQREKQAAFSIGMTLLHSALLQSPAFCYEVSSKRLNKKKLEHLKMKLSKKYSNSLTQLISSLLDLNPVTRLGFHEIQTSISDLSADPQFIHSFSDNHFDNNGKRGVSENSAMEQPQESNKKQETISASSNHNINNSEITLSSYANPMRKSEFQIIFDPSSKKLLKIESRPGQKAQSIAVKENVFTDSSIMNMIKEGLNKIQKSAKERQAMKEIHSQNVDNNQTKPTPVSSNQDLLSQYELKTISTQKDCVYVVQQYEDQSRYEGTIINGMKNGIGKLIYPDGVFYEGNFKNDTLSGKGSLYYGPNRPAYVGDWQNNKFNGFGTLYNEYPTMMGFAFDYSDFNKIEDQWIKFEGNFKEDIKDGMGKITLTNGERIEAFFSSGVINGEGTFTDFNGRTIKGVWSGNKLLNLIQ